MEEYILGLDVSTTTIGISLFENKGKKGKLKLLHHITPKIKPKPDKKLEELFKKIELLEEFLEKYKNFNIKTVVIEEPLLQSNNTYTISTLAKFNGMVSNSVYKILKIVPDFISSYDARKYGFPELMSVRKTNKKGEKLTEKQIKKNTPVLFGDYPFDVDKKMVIYEKVANLEPQIVWLYDKNNKLKKENFDMADSYTCVIGYMHKEGFWV